MFKTMKTSSKHKLNLLFFLSIFLSSTASDWNTFKNLSGSRPGQKVTGLSKLKNYLHRFGYNTTNITDEYDDELVSAVKLYQRNFNLNRTGELDEPTVTQIIKPRCGVPDVIEGTWPMYAHPYASIEPEIPVGRDFTYAFDPRNNVSDKVKRVFVSAFKRWSKWSQVTFSEDTEYYSNAEIKIGFYSGIHGDGEAFDGVLGTLGHAYAWPKGMLHLDNDETWIIDGMAGFGSVTAVDMETVVVHEIGHMLGLGHSSLEDAVMFPTISTGVRKVELAGDDVEGVRHLYGSNGSDNGFGREMSGDYSERIELVWILVFIMSIGLLTWFSSI